MMMYSQMEAGGFVGPTTTAVTSASPLNQQQRISRLKRKADTQDNHNERLSKRLSLLNLEQNGPKLYIPVEQPQIQQTISTTPFPSPNVLPIGDDTMHLDDTKHKVYIYNLDDELSSENESDLDDREGRLAFLPDIEKHLRANRIPISKPIVPNKDGELASMQLVLYSDGPSSISVPESQDSVRKAIIEARARVRQKQEQERQAGGPAVAAANYTVPKTHTFATPIRMSPLAPPEETMGEASDAMRSPVMNFDDDPDAMDID